MDVSLSMARLRGPLIAAGALTLGVPMFYLEIESTAGLAVSFAGFLLLMTGLYDWKRAAADERSRRRGVLVNVGGEADVAGEAEALPRRDPFEDGDG